MPSWIQANGVAAHIYVTPKLHSFPQVVGVGGANVLRSGGCFCRHRTLQPTRFADHRLQVSKCGERNTRVNSKRRAVKRRSVKLCDLLGIFKDLAIEKQWYIWCAMSDCRGCEYPSPLRRLYLCRSAWVLRRRSGFGISACSSFECFDAATQLAKFLADLKECFHRASPPVYDAAGCGIHLPPHCLAPSHSSSQV